MSGPEEPDRRIHEEPIEEDAAPEDDALAPQVTTAEGIDPAQTAAALAQDPDEVPNRVHAGDPPRPEVAGPDGRRDGRPHAGPDEQD